MCATHDETGPVRLMPDHARTPATPSATETETVEEVFGWLKTVGLLRKSNSGRVASRLALHLRAAVYNLVRMRNLVEATT